MRCGGLSDHVIALGIDQLILYVSASAFEAGMLERSGIRVRAGSADRRPGDAGARR
jgi:hypothetical protein